MFVEVAEGIIDFVFTCFLVLFNPRVVYVVSFFCMTFFGK